MDAGVSSPILATIEPLCGCMDGKKAAPRSGPPRPCISVRPGLITEVVTWRSHGSAAARQRRAEDDRVIDLALAVHADWKAELRRRVDARAALDVKAVGSDTACALGTWMHGAGARFAGNPDFEEARVWHRRFHAASAVAAVHATAGRWADAAAVFRGSSFEATSLNLVSALERLRHSARPLTLVAP
jgi:hypothetical protein